MSRVIPGRMSHQYSGELVVFLIGMRVSKPWRPDLWLPAFMAMPRMLRELFTDRESGLIGARFTVGAGGPVVIQYWSSLEKLYAYASNRDAEHRPAWTAFNKRARKAPGAVGIWHETYSVAGAESMYVGMPVSGLALATESVEVNGRNDAARDRMRDGAARSAVPSPTD
ncbi:DUF4188 domain-containing protein [Amnibacterium flavum]|uniref:DUF4188 domain-containing protein n=1 Tax=Amnibacterium flavum TaxID=2173173 RepID=A0A2V1HSW4_9MICO|nr:DUF4188 domain-containing protein [Amnibacterium flavum]PVZ94050.1 DUF4188 domain-containing protein [Amnibacterium flavum]